jgi:acetyltransferase-like isoleucine patch superfamily enzyme
MLIDMYLGPYLFQNPNLIMVAISRRAYLVISLAFLLALSSHKSSLGRYSYVGENSLINRSVIGNFTCIGPGVLVNLGTHPSYRKSIHPAFYSKNIRAAKAFVKEDSYDEYGNVIIGNDVWIGARAIILGDVTIPDGVIIAAGSIVKKNDVLEPYGIYGGSPLVLLKMRKYAETHKISEQWWNLDDQKLIERLDEFI